MLETLVCSLTIAYQARVTNKIKTSGGITSLHFQSAMTIHQIAVRMSQMARKGKKRKFMLLDMILRWYNLSNKDNGARDNKNLVREE